MRIPLPSAATLRGGNSIARSCQIFDHESVLCVNHHGARRHENQQVFATATLTIASLAMTAAFGFPQLTVGDG